MNSLRNVLLAGVVMALVSPVAALAQAAPPDGPPQGPPPEMRAQFEQARDQAKTAAMNDLSADHRAKVQAIIAQVQSGSLDPRDAGTQIDGILSPSESQAVLGEAQKLRDAMHKAMQNAGPPRNHMNHKPDAGRILMMLNLGPRPPQ